MVRDAALNEVKMIRMPNEKSRCFSQWFKPAFFHSLEMDLIELAIGEIDCRIKSSMLDGGHFSFDLGILEPLIG